jgi:hypothetical protein
MARCCTSAGVSQWTALQHVMGYQQVPSLLTSTETRQEWMAMLIPIGETVSRRSTTALLAQYNKYIVLWRSRMQKTIAQSTTEAQYYVTSEFVIEINYLSTLLRNMGFPQDDDTPVYEGNTACIEWGDNIFADVSVLSTSTSASTLLMK